MDPISPPSTSNLSSPQPPPQPSPPITPAALPTRRKSRIGFPPILIILLIVFLLAGGFGLWWFFSNRSTPVEQITLTYWGLHEPESVMQPLFDQYMATHPNIKINYINSSPSEYRQRLAAQLTTEDFNGPDIFRFHNTWVPMFKQSLTPIPENIFSTSEFNNTFHPVTQTDLKNNGKYVGIPLMFDGLGLFYNEDLFIAAGLDPPITMEWPAFRDLAMKLKTTDNNKNLVIGGVPLGLASNIDHWQDIISVMMLQAKADLAKPEGTTAQNTLNFYSIFTKTDKSWDTTLPNSTLAFATGKVGMYFGTASDIITITELSRQHNTPVRFKVVPIPQLPEINTTWATYWVEGVSQRSSRSVQTAAWDLLKYLSEREIMEQRFQLQELNRGFGVPYSRIDLADQLKDHPQLGAFVLQAPAARSWYLVSDTTDVDGLNDRINKEYLKIVDLAGRGTVGGSDLKKATQAIQKVLVEYGLATRPTESK